MFSERKNTLVMLEKYRHTRVVNEEKDKKQTLGANDSNEFSMRSDCVSTCQESSFLSLNEKRSKLLKLLEKDSTKAETLKANEEDDSESDDENNNLNLEKAGESTLMQLPLEISESASEEGDNDEKEWGQTDENQFSLGSVCGLSEIKETLFNILIYPSFYPRFFPKGIRWNQILLYGPPGTGKTMLTKALANEIDATLHRITSADLLSHWQGQTEKQIRTLFQEIRSSPEPKILFFDEVDGLFRRRTSEENDNTRRIKTELLIHLDDFTADFENHQTFFIGATNCPWEIDLSFMRRFHKKIFVPLPDRKARLDILKKNFETIETDLTDLEWSIIGDKTEGFSGSDLVNVVMTSCCERFMETKNSKYWETRGDVWVPVSSCSMFAIQMNFEEIHPDKIGVRSIKFTDLMEALSKTPKTVEPEALMKYLEFSGEKTKWNEARRNI